MPQILHDIITTLDARGVTEPFVLAGHSFGGAIVTELAYHYPERISKLILIASAGEYRIHPTFRTAFRLPDPVLRLIQPAVRNLVDASVPALKRFFIQNLRVWEGWETFPLLKPPTMIIMGEKDIVLPQEAFARVAELMPEAEVVNVGVSAHMVMLERRDAVNRAIERFIETDPAGRHVQWRGGDSGQLEPGTGTLLAERPWLVHYESGVPFTIDVPRLPLTRLMDRAWRRFPRRPAIIYQGRTISYKTLSAQAGRFANALQSLGVSQGSKVMLLLPNVPHLVIAFFGTLRLGAVVVMGNPLSTTAEIIREARFSEAEVLVTLTRFKDKAAAIKEDSQVRHVIYANVKDYLPFLKQIAFTLFREKAGGDHLENLEQADRYWGKLLRQQNPKPPEVKIDPEDTAVIQFTGGTTSTPKGVTLSHRNLVANVMQTRSWIPDLQDGKNTILCTLPFSHVYGMTTAMNFAVSTGSSMILLPTFDTEEVLEHIRKYRPTLFPGVPAMYVAINNFPGVRKYNIRSINACLSGAAPLPIEVKEAFEKLTKGKLVEGYGLSEASPVTHANPFYGRNKTGSIGIPLPNTEARIMDLRTGKPLPPGQIGELVVRGPQVMAGYWQDEEQTRQVLDAEGWLRTNDIARMDEDGYFQIISRRQDMWTGEDERPAFPRDVEEVIYELPEVREVVVVALANRPIAFVSVKDRARLPAKTIIAFCQRRLPPEQVPRLVIFVNDFPRSFIGKVLRRELIARYQNELTTVAGSAEAGSVGDYLVGLED
jgi:long-chain acyl-CoA synthetase